MEWVMGWVGYTSVFLILKALSHGAHSNHPYVCNLKSATYFKIFSIHDSVLVASICVQGIHCGVSDDDDDWVYIYELEVEKLIGRMEMKVILTVKCLLSLKNCQFFRSDDGFLHIQHQFLRSDEDCSSDPIFVDCTD
ncbi:hypothetical protein Hanom_Chr15g01349661 [Helianthus anomalus]